MRAGEGLLRTMRLVGNAATETASLTGAPSAQTARPLPSRRWLMAAGCTWAVAALFVVVTLLWSHHVGVGLRDPQGRMLRHKLIGAVELFLVLAAVDVVVRTVRASRGHGWSWTRLREQLVERWGVRRLALLLSTLLAYHLVYFSYRNMKSWDALNTPRDHDLAAVDKWLFFGHTPASVLHDLLGQGHPTATVLAHAYEVFSQVVSVAIVAAPAFITRTRRGMVMVTAGLWAWVLGTISYYAVPSLGPCFTASPGQSGSGAYTTPTDFAGLPPTLIQPHWTDYWQQRSAFLADPSDPHTFVSISAFASLHVGLTCLIVLMAAYYRKRLLTILLAVYLVAVMASTVYFGWHFFVDVLAGLVLAVASIALGHLTVYPRTLLPRRRAAR